MKKILLLMSMLWGIAYGQSTGYLRYDTVRIEKVGGNAELILMNATRNVTGGVLTNIGNGRTAFITPSGGSGDSSFRLNPTQGYGLITVNDSTLRADSTALATRLYLSSLLQLKLNTADSAAMLAGYVRNNRFFDSLAAHHTRIQGKVNISDTSAMLTNYVRTNRDLIAGYGLTGGGNLSANRTFTLDSGTVFPQIRATITGGGGGGGSTPDTTEKIHGSLYNSNSWASLADFTNSSSGASVVSNKIAFTGGTGLNTNTLALTPQRLFNNTTATFKFQVGTKSGTSTGGRFGFISTNGNVASSLGVEFDQTTGGNSGKITITTGNAYTASAVSTSAVSFSVNDYIIVTLTKFDLGVIATARNFTTGAAPISVTYTFPISSLGLTTIAPNTGRFGIWNRAGDFTLDSLSVSSFNLKYSELMMLADSRGLSAGATNQSYSLQAYLSPYFHNFVNMSGNGDRTADLINRLDDAIALAPKKVILYVGVNDIGGGVSSATYLANYDTITARLTRAGIDVYHLISYASAVSQSTLFSHITSTYASGKILDAYSNTQYTGILNGDGIHNTDLGNSAIADIILSTFKIEKNSDYKLQYPVFAQRDVTQSAGFLINGTAGVGKLDVTNTAAVTAVTVNTNQQAIADINSTHANGGYVSLSAGGSVGAYLGLGPSTIVSGSALDFGIRPNANVIITNSSAQRRFTFIPATSNFIIGSATSTSYALDMTAASNFYARFNTINATGAYNSFSISDVPKAYQGIGTGLTTGAGNDDWTSRVENGNWYWTNSSGNPVMRLTSGNLGIGITPTQKLDVNGVTRLRTVNAGTSKDSILTLEDGLIKSIDLSGNLVAADTTNKWVNRIERTPGKDSIIFYINTTRYAVKDSTGGSAVDTSNKWVNLIYRKAGKDSIFFRIGATEYAIKDSIASLDEGTYTPSVSNTGNITGTPTTYTTHYQRQGSSVDVWGKVTLVVTTGASATSFDLSLPPAFPTSMSDGYDAVGSGTSQYGLSGSGLVYAAGSNVTMSFTPTSSGSRDFYFRFKYLIE